MNDGSIISIPDSDISVHTILDNAETTSINDHSPLKQQLHACALFVNHWTDGAIKDGLDLHSAKKTYVEGLKEKPAETSTIIFEKNNTEDVMDSKRSKLIKSPAKSNKGDESRKENTVNCYTSPPAIMSRRNTVFHANIQKTPVTEKGRRKTQFIDPVDIASKKSKQLAASSSTTKTKLFGSDSTRKEYTNTSSTKNRIANRLAGLTKEKLNDHPPASKHNSVSSHRENNQSSSSSSRRTSTQVPTQPSSSHRHSSTSTSHRSVSSPKRTESHRPSTSSESTGHRSDYKKHRTNKRKSSIDRHDQKRRRLSETETKICSKGTEPKTPVPGKVHNDNTDRSKELKDLDDSSDSLDLLVPLYSVDLPNPKVIVKNIMPKNTKGNQSAKRVAPTEPKTIKSKKRNSKSQSRERPKLDPAMNPSVLLRRLKLNLSKLHANDKIKLNVMDDKYIVYDVNGVFKIKKKKKKEIRDGRQSNDELSVACTTKDKSKGVANKKTVEQTTSSHDRRSKDALSEICETKGKIKDVANKKIVQETSHDRRSKDGLSETKDVAKKKIVQETSHDRRSKDGLSETKDKTKDVANKKIVQETSHDRRSKDGLSETKDKTKDVTKKKNVETANFSTQTKSILTRSLGVQKVDNEVETLTRKHTESIALFTQSVREYETAVCEQHQTIRSLKESIQEQKDNVKERENKIAERERMIAERDLKINERERMIAERDLKINERDSQIQEFEEQVKLQESKIKYMTIEMDRLKRSEKSLSALLKEKDAECKEKHQNDQAMPPKILNGSRVLQNGADTTFSPIRVKNIDQLRGKCSPAVNNQPFYGMSSNAMNTIANSMLPGQNAEVVQTTNVYEWTVDAAPTHNQFSQNVTPAPTQYVCMYNPPATTQSTTATATTNNTDNYQPTTTQSISTNATPHQNLPRIIQKTARPMPIQLKTYSRPNNTSGSQMRGRSSTIYYGPQAIADSTAQNSISTSATPNPNLPTITIIQKTARPIPKQPNTMTQSNNPYNLISDNTQEGSMQNQSHAELTPRNRSKSCYYDKNGSTYEANILRYRQIMQRQESQAPFRKYTFCNY